jgi:K+-sensing histidine kinase KdpD
MARRALAELITDQPERAQALMDRLGTPKDGRLRHLVASVVRGLASKEIVIPYLVKWRTKETDEFTRRAIDLVLSQVPAPLAAGVPLSTSATLYPGHVAETYQFIASRLKHKLSNGLMKAHTHLMRLTSAVQAHNHDEGPVSAAITDLKEEFSRLARAVEAVDVDPAHFDVRPIALVEWLNAMNGRYASRFTQVDLRLEGDLYPVAVIDASDYLLETVFWNAWLNAQDAAGPSCQLSIKVTRGVGSVALFAIDNGPGFPETVREAAFMEQVSTNGANRGRGLLEIDDAMRRLQGGVKLVEDDSGAYRLLFEFPTRRS